MHIFRPHTSPVESEILGGGAQQAVFNKPSRNIWCRLVSRTTTPESHTPVEDSTQRLVVSPIVDASHALPRLPQGSVTLIMLSGLRCKGSAPSHQGGLTLWCSSSFQSCLEGWAWSQPPVKTHPWLGFRLSYLSRPTALLLRILPRWITCPRSPLLLGNPTCDRRGDTGALGQLGGSWLAMVSGIHKSKGGTEEEFYSSAQRLWWYWWQQDCLSPE